MWLFYYGRFSTDYSLEKLKKFNEMVLSQLLIASGSTQTASPLYHLFLKQNDIQFE